jgi:hypothetical protein
MLICKHVKKSKYNNPKSKRVFLTIFVLFFTTISIFAFPYITLMYNQDNLNNPKSDKNSNLQISEYYSYIYKPFPLYYLPEPEIDPLSYYVYRELKPRLESLGIGINFKFYQNLGTFKLHLNVDASIYLVSNVLYIEYSYESLAFIAGNSWEILDFIFSVAHKGNNGLFGLDVLREGKVYVTLKFDLSTGWILPAKSGSLNFHLKISQDFVEGFATSINPIFGLAWKGAKTFFGLWDINLLEVNLYGSLSLNIDSTNDFINGVHSTDISLTAGVGLELLLLDWVISI